jgi:hypothetical protein
MGHGSAVVASELIGPAAASSRLDGDGQGQPGDVPAAAASRLPAWPAKDSVVVVTASPAGYNRALGETLRRLVADFRHGAVVAANRPTWLLREALAADGVATDGITFIDCVTSSAGLPARPEPSVVHIESTALLEKVVLRSEQVLRRLHGPRFLLVDSLCAFALHNGSAPAAEFAHALTSRARALAVPVAWMVIERDANLAVQDAVRPMCDGSLRL